MAQQRGNAAAESGSGGGAAEGECCPGCHSGTPETARCVALSTMKPGDHGTIVRTELPEGERALLRAMGMRDNARIVLCRLGEPCIVRVMGGCGCSFRIGLAKPLADKVMVGPR